MKKESANIEFADKKLLGLLVVCGLSVSAISIVMIGGGFSLFPNSHPEIKTLCDDGLCSGNQDWLPIGTFVQQEASTEFNEDIVFSKNENFGSINILKYKPSLGYKLNENSVTLFASKDSFVREAIQTSNEGSNQVLRVMGSGPTNNRVLIAFDQEKIIELKADRVIEEATLRLFIISNDQNWENGQNLEIFKLQTQWSEGTGVNAPFGDIIGSDKGVTWNCSLGSSSCNSNWNGGLYVETSTDSVFITNESDGQWVEFDVTADVLDFISDSSNNGWIIMKSEEDSPGRINFASRESDSNFPELILEFQIMEGNLGN